MDSNKETKQIDMKIWYDNTFLEVAVNDNSYRYRAIKGDHNLTLYYSLPEHIELPVGAYCEFQSETYTLEAPENFKMHNSRNFEYTVIFESSQAKAKKYKFKNPVDRRLKFNLTATPREHLQMFVDNMNMRDSGWAIGECIEATAKLISYNHAFCMDALSQQAEEFETEYEFNGKVVSLCKVEYNRDNPLPLSYGKGKGFKPGVGRTNFSDSKPIEVLFVQGGERNIDPSKYKNNDLLLPKNQTLRYDGKFFEGQTGFNTTVARTYISDTDGFSIQRQDKPLRSKEEDSLDLSHIYPSRVGKVTAVKVTKEGFCDFIDVTIPDNLDFEKCLIEGETMNVIFQSGMLVGKEFDVKYVHSERVFKVVEQTIDGEPMPKGSFMPIIGDSYAVFGIALPDAYVCDNTTKVGASWDMFKEAAKYLYENEEQKFTFTGELDGIWAKKDWINIGGRIKLGGYILFSDPQFQPDGVGIRIVGIKDFINNPHSPEIELSNMVVGSSIMSDLRKIESNEVFNESQHKGTLQFTKRRFKDAIETMGMLKNALLDNFSGSINPITVQTMSMLVGDESLQFVFVQSLSSVVEIPHNITYNQQSKQLSIPSGYLQHKTIGIQSISSEYTANEYKTWYLPAFSSAVLTDAVEKYYVYAKVSKSTQTGVFIISPTPIVFEGVGGYYHLLLGILNSEFEGERSYVSLHGYTEILPGQVLTQRIVSSNGKNFMDFLNNAFRIGDDNCYLDWNASISNLLGIKNANIQIANVAGKTMVYLNGTNGSGQLAGGNITWDADGNIKAKGGTFTDIILHGSSRNPFVRETDSIVIGGKQSTHDNVATISDGGGWITAGSLEWGVEQSGRRMCITNYRWGSVITEGKISYSAPTGQYFYEDGIMKKSIYLSRECVELMGYGTETQFYGWIVLNRINLGTNARYGRKVNALAQGIVSGHSSGASINCKTFDDSTLSVTRLDEGQYQVDFPSAWGLTAGNYIVMMTGYGEGLMKASLLKQDASYFTVDVSDDASRNDGSFMFQIINIDDWMPNDKYE